MDDIGHVVLVDESGVYYAFAASVLGGAGDLTAEQVEAGRLTDAAREAVQMAFGYERVGQVCGPASAAGDEVVLGERRFTVVGAIGAL